MGTIQDFIPARFTLSSWPSDIVAMPSAFDSIGIANLGFSNFTGAYFVATGSLQWLKEIAFDLPLIPGVSVALLSSGGITEVDFECTYSFGEFSVCLTDLSASLRIESTLLKKVELSGDEWVVAVDGTTGGPEAGEGGGRGRGRGGAPSRSRSR